MQLELFASCCSSPGMMQLINMAGVVASPNCATLTPWLAIPATMDVSSSGPDNRESLPICTCILSCVELGVGEALPLRNESSRYVHMHI